MGCYVRRSARSAKAVYGFVPLAAAGSGFDSDSERQESHQHVENEWQQDEVVDDAEGRDREVEGLEGVQGQDYGCGP